MAPTLLAIALGAMAVAATPASATLTPVNSTVTASSSNTAWTRAGLGARCPTSTFIGRIAADGRSISGDLTLSNHGRTTCSGTFGVSCEATTGGGSPTTITLRSTGSTAGGSATFDVIYDADFTLNFSCLGGGLVCTISGPQTIRGAATLIQSTPSTLATDMRRINCGEGGSSERTATYTFAERLTIS
jgi:hypothetical protein